MKQRMPPTAPRYICKALDSRLSVEPRETGFAMPTPVLMPQMGESIAEGTIVRWIKKWVRR